MCGICGGWLSGGLPNPAVEKSFEAMRHRGPDDSGCHNDGNVAIGMVRLSIIDLPGGHQPMFNEDHTIAVVFNGEIYNYLELKADLKRNGHRFQTDSDTEVLVHLYEEEGADLCKRLSGMFAFAVWDAGRRRLLLARDRFGKKPLYYARTKDEGIIFASELKALRPLMRAAGVSADVRPQSIYDYLSLGSVPQPDTIYRDVRSLPMGSHLLFDGRNARVAEYWSPNFSVKRKISYRESLQRTRELVAEAVRLRLRSDVPLGMFLSGGVDSSVIAYEASRQLGGNLQCFTVSMNSDEFDESSVALRTAEKLGVRCSVLPLKTSPREDIQYIVRQYDQPHADSSAIPSVAVSRLARQHVSVILNGDGGDEVFAGYRRHLAAKMAYVSRWMPRSLIAGASLLSRGISKGVRRSPLGFAGRFARGLKEPWATRYLIWTGDMLLESDKQRLWKGNPMRPTEELLNSAIPSGLSGLDKQLWADIHFTLQNGLLVKMDRATMSASLEGRSPLLDHHLIEFTASLPDEFRIRNGRLKSLLRDAYAGFIPDEVIKGKKRGFEIPLQEWLKNDLREMVDDVLRPSSARIYDYLDSKYVENLLDEKICMERNWKYLVYGLLMLELWFQEYC